MRVVSGFLGGRNVKSVPGITTRPTLDKVKESLFNALGQYFSGGLALDLFAGSGNLGIEAISRGINQCVFVDSDNKAIQVIKDNLNTLKIDLNAEIYKMDAFKALDMFKTKKYHFDYIFLDPPYKQQKINEILINLVDNQLIIDDGTIIVECLKEDELLKNYKELHLIKEYKYGITKITIYKKNGDSNE